MRNLILFSISMLAGCVPAPAQAQARIERPAGRTPDSWIAPYVESKQRETEALRTAGLESEWRFVHQQVERHLQSQSYPSNNAAGEARPATGPGT